MQFRLYLLDISELEDSNLQQKALLLMDSYRREKVNKYKTVKGRMQQIATGLLLQIGLLELDMRGKQLPEKPGTVCLCTISDALQALELWQEANGKKLPIEAEYGEGEHGKPFWKQAFLDSLPLDKAFEQFSISHSGQYAALVIADSEIGLDIQESRKVISEARTSTRKVDHSKYIEGGYDGFSRMEAYVKCTGAGYACGFAYYKEMQGNVPGYHFFKINVIRDYAIYLCCFE